MKQKTMSYVYLQEFPNLDKLMDIYGIAEASRMLGLSDIRKAVGEKKVRPAYEMAAAYLLKSKQVDDKPTSLVLKMTKSQSDVVVAFLDAMKISYMDLDL